MLCEIQNLDERFLDELCKFLNDNDYVDLRIFSFIFKRL